MPIGGDASPYQCPNCASTDTIFEEWADSRGFPDYQGHSELGILCNDCEHVVEPDDMGSLLDEEH
jgi:hypothetical protein